MSHLDAGAIVTLRDGGPVAEDVRSHAATCAVCRRALDEAVERGRRVEATLRAMEPVDHLDMEAAKAAVRLRLDRKRAAEHRRRPIFPAALGRAAALLLLAAGVAYALPGSPLRSWWAAETATDAPATAPAPALDGGAAREGIELAIPAGGMTIALLDLSPSTPVEVIWIDGARASVAAGPGARYAISEGRAEARTVDGPVRLELPRSGPPLVVESGGRPVLIRDDGGVRIDGVVMEEGQDRVVFRSGPG